jgi:hypothetical protein
MKPTFLSGDRVKCIIDAHWTRTGVDNGTVISVVQSDMIPDASVRGIQVVWSWSYYVLLDNGPKVLGPVPSWALEGP